MSCSYKDLSQKIIINPEDLEETEETRCRICYDTIKPLISVCSCSGSMAYVHEDCILDWITKKIESSDRVQIPNCEICHEKYSARMKIGTKKICPNILYDKIRRLPTIQKAITIGHCLTLVMVFITLASFLLNLFSGAFFTQKTAGEVIKDLFLQVICQGYAYYVCQGHYWKRKRLVEESMIQIVEVTLQPKVALRC